MRTAMIVSVLLVGLLAATSNAQYYHSYSTYVYPSPVYVTPAPIYVPPPVYYSPPVFVHPPLIRPYCAPHHSVYFNYSHGRHYGHHRSFSFGFGYRHR